MTKNTAEQTRLRSSFPCHNRHLNWKLRIAAAQAGPIHRHSNIRPDDGHAACEACNSPEEVAKQDGNTICLDNEPNKGPFHEDEYQAGEECSGAFGLLLAGEEEEGLLGSDDDGETNEEEDLDGIGVKC